MGWGVRAEVSLPRGNFEAHSLEAVGPDFAIMYRLSTLDLVAGSNWVKWSVWPKSLRPLASMSSTPELDGTSPHPDDCHDGATGGFRFVTQKLMGKVNAVGHDQPIQRSEDCESALSEGCADMISMARPFLADPHLVKKARLSRPEAPTRASAATRLVWTIFKQRWLRVWSTHGHVMKRFMVRFPDQKKAKLLMLEGMWGAQLSGTRIAVLGAALPA